MGERGHTKGPWSVREYGDGDSLVVHAGEDWRICFMATPGSSPNAMERIEANARLIAAAPDMFEALKAIAGYPAEGSPRRTDDGYPLEFVYDEFAYKRIVDTYREAARAALSKATPTGEASDV